MSHLRSARLRQAGGGGFPFDVPAIRSIAELSFDSAVTFFVGENGSGKSTLLEGLALAAALPTIGSASASDDAGAEHPPLALTKRRLMCSFPSLVSAIARTGLYASTRSRSPRSARPLAGVKWNLPTRGPGFLSTNSQIVFLFIVALLLSGVGERYRAPGGPG